MIIWSNSRSSKCSGTHVDERLNQHFFHIWNQRHLQRAIGHGHILRAMPSVNGPQSVQNTGLNRPVQSTPLQNEGELAGRRVAKTNVDSPSLTTGDASLSGPSGKTLSERKVSVQSAVTKLIASSSASEQQKAGLSERINSHLESSDGRALGALLDTPWIREKLASGEPLSQGSIEQLCDAAYVLEQQVTKGVPDHTLAWRADSLLGDRIDTQSSEQLTSLVSKTINTLSKQSEALGDKVGAGFYGDAVASLKAAGEKETSAEQLVAVSQSLNTLLKDYPSLPDKELLEGLQLQVKDQLQTQAREEFKQALSKQLSGLEKGGSKTDIVLGFELGVAAAHLIGVNVGVRYTFDVSARDDGRLIDRSSVTGSIDLVLGEGHIVRADIGGALTASKGRLFENLDDFVDYHANDILPMLLGKAIKSPRNAKGIFKARQSDATHAQTVANRDQLQQKLIAKGILEPGARLVTEDRRRSDYMAISEKSAEGWVQLSALDDMLAGRFTLSNTKTEFRRHVALQDAFHTNPELLAQEPDKYFAVHVQGKDLAAGEGRQWLQSTARLINNLKTEHQACLTDNPERAKTLEGMIEHVRGGLREGIAALYAEYDHYGAVVNRYDSKTDSAQEFHSDLGELKHRMEKARGSNGRGEFLRAVSATHAELSRVYSSSFSSGLPPSVQDKEAGRMFSRMEADYRMPQLHLTDKQVKSRLSVQTSNTATQSNKVGELKLKVPYTPLMLSAAVRTEHLEGHFNEDMDGDYLNLTVRLDAGANMQSVLGSIQSGLPNAIGGVSKTFASSLPTDLAFGLDTAGQLECHFIKGEKGYCLQYLRFSGEKGIGGSTPEIPVVAAPWGDVKVKAEGAMHERTNLKEYVGNNTLTYFFTRYNGWVDGGKASGDEQSIRSAGQSDKAGGDYWDQFVHNNQPQIKMALKNMVNPDKNIAMELDTKLERIGDEDFTTNFKASLDNYKKDPSDQNYKAALADFCEFMALNHKHQNQQARDSFAFKASKK